MFRPKRACFDAIISLARIVPCIASLILLSACLHSYELKKRVPTAEELGPYKVVQTTSNSFTLEGGRGREIAMGAPPTGVHQGDTLQAMTNCWDDLLVGCRRYVEFILPDGRAYHYWLKQPRR